MSMMIEKFAFPCRSRAGDDSSRQIQVSSQPNGWLALMGHLGRINVLPRKLPRKAPPNASTGIRNK